MAEKRDQKLPSNRNFGLVFFVVFGFMSALLFYKDSRQLALIFLSLSFLSFFLAFFFSRLLTPFNFWWSRFGYILSRIMNTIILGLIFFVVITPIGLLMRLFSPPSPMKTFSTDKKTYWVFRKPPGPAPESIKEQF